MQPAVLNCTKKIVCRFGEAKSYIQVIYIRRIEQTKELDCHLNLIQKKQTAYP